MKTFIHASEQKVRESFDKNEVPLQHAEAIKHRVDQSSQKNFGVVDLWKIRSMKKYFNYQ